MGAHGERTLLCRPAGLSTVIELADKDTAVAVRIQRWHCALSTQVLTHLCCHLSVLTGFMVLAVQQSAGPTIVLLLRVRVLSPLPFLLCSERS